MTSKNNRHSQFDISINHPYIQQIQELKEELFSSSHTNSHQLDQHHIQTNYNKKHQYNSPQKPQTHLKHKTPRMHPDIQAFLAKYFHGQSKYLTQELISCIIKEYSYLWRGSKTKQILQYFIKNLRISFPGNIVSLETIIHATSDNGLDGLVNNIFGQINHPDSNISETQRKKSQFFSTLQLSSTEFHLRVQQMIGKIEDKLKARIQVQMRKLQFKEQQIQQLLHFINNRIQQLNEKYANLGNEQQSVQELRNIIKIQEVQLCQSKFMISTVKSINMKLQQENLKLNQKVEKFNDYLLKQHDLELRKYRSIFNRWADKQSWQKYRSHSHCHNRSKSMETVQDDSMIRQTNLNNIMSTQQIICQGRSPLGRKSNQRLTIKKPMNIVKASTKSTKQIQK